MSQLMIKDLEFCEGESLENQKIRGSGSFFNVEFDVSQFFEIVSLAGSARGGSAAAIALAIGDKIKIALGTGVV